jgi:membrane-associated phospholipid phosphatase
MAALLPDAPSATRDQNNAPPSSPDSGGASSEPQSSAKSWAHRFVTDQRDIYTAPFHRSAIKWDLLFLAGTAGLIAADDHISGAIPPGSKNVSRAISNAGLIGTSAALGGILVVGLKDDDSHARETGILGLEALANTGVVYALAQVAAGRERPLEGTGEGRFFQNNTLGSSFPSGHSAFTWTMATVIAEEYPKPWVQVLAYGTATAVSVTRVTGLEHFPADVAVGGVTGYLIGRYVFHAHCRPGLSASCKK